MKIDYVGKIESDDFIDEISAEGTIYIAHQWIPIETSVQVRRETEKAYFGNVTVYECDSVGRVDTLFEKTDTWVPKSMSDNPWWICTVKFEHQGKVSNKRFEENDYW